MSKLFDFRGAPAVALTFALAAQTFSATAAPTRIEPFTAPTWSEFQSALPRPMAVVFTTTDCAYCPDAIEQLAREIRRRPAQTPIRLIVVVMDGAGQPELLRDPHYRPADRLFAFAAPPAALQYAINPKWRGVTPYVALFGSHGAPQLITGRPGAAALDLWLGAGAAPTGPGGK